MFTKEIRPLSLSQCWELVNGCKTHDDIACAERWMLKADITMEEYDELMNELTCLSRELYSRRWN